MKSSCPHCKYEAQKKGDLRAHEQSVHEEVTLDCTYCKSETTHNRDLKTHTQTDHVKLTFNISHIGIPHRVKQIPENEVKLPPL